jgi:hypothetical protein
MHKIYHISRITLFIIWFHHGLVPKIIFKDQQEITMNEKLIPFLSENQALLYSGVSEIIYAFLILLFYKSKIILIPSILFSVLVTFVLLFTFPNFFTHAFNPFSINLSVMTLALINYYANPYNTKPTEQ